MYAVYTRATPCYLLEASFAAAAQFASAMMASTRPPDRVPARVRPPSAPVKAGDALNLLHQELSSVPDREPLVVDESEDKAADTRAALSGKTEL